MSNPQNNANSSREHFQVGVVLMNIHDEVLLIQEIEPDVSQPDSTGQNSTAQDAAQNTGGKWRLPYDHLHAGDDLPDRLSGAAFVIGARLTAYDFDMHDICYIGLHEGPCVVVIYVADRPYSLHMTEDPDPEKVATIGWFTYERLLKLNEEGLLRDPEMTLAAVKNAQQGLTVPSEIITTPASE